MPTVKLKKGANYVTEDGKLLSNEEEVEITDDQMAMIGDVFLTAEEQAAQEEAAKAKAELEEAEAKAAEAAFEKQQEAEKNKTEYRSPQERPAEAEGAESS